MAMAKVSTFELISFLQEEGTIPGAKTIREMRRLALTLEQLSEDHTTLLTEANIVTFLMEHQRRLPLELHPLAGSENLARGTLDEVSNTASGRTHPRHLARVDQTAAESLLASKGYDCLKLELEQVRQLSKQSSRLAHSQYERELEALYAKVRGGVVPALVMDSYLHLIPSAWLASETMRKFSERQVIEVAQLVRKLGALDLEKVLARSEELRQDPVVFKRLELQLSLWPSLWGQSSILSPPPQRHMGRLDLHQLVLTHLPPAPDNDGTFATSTRPVMPTGKSSKPQGSRATSSTVEEQCLVQ